MKKMRKGISLVTVFLLAVCLFAGCGGLGGDGPAGHDGKNAKGSYVERQIELPLSADERGVSLVARGDGTYELYTYAASEKKYNAYVSSDGENFTPGDADWINRAVGGQDCYMKGFFAGDDGAVYAFYYKDERDHLISNADSGKNNETAGNDGTVEDDETAEELFSEVFAQRSGIDMVGILENGNLVTSDSINGRLEVWSAGDKSILCKMEQGTSSVSGLNMFDCKDKKAAVLNRNNNGFCVFDLESGTAEQEIAYDFSGSEDYGVLKLGPDGDCFYVDRNGLHHIGKGGSTVETIMEGSLVSLGDSSKKIVDFALGKHSDYLVLFNDNGRGSLMRYVYDKNARVTPEKQLVIFSLEENKTIRQAVSRFQQSHTDIKVVYKTGNWRETGTTRADQIRVLNTELLGGSGADILVLDHLPVESYIDKGVLMDLSSFYEELKKESPPIENVVNSMKTGDGLYQLPARVRALSVFGTDEEVAALQSLDSLAAYLDGGDAKDIMEGKNSYEYYLRLLMTLNYKTLFNGKGKSPIPEERLRKLLETAGKMCRQTGTQADTVKNSYAQNGSDVSEEKLIQEIGGTDFLYSVESRNELRARKGRQAVVNEMNGAFGLTTACEVLRELGKSPQGINGLYIPAGMVGINSSSKNTEAAFAFMKLLFSEEIQDLDLYDGFPVNRHSLDKWGSREKPEDGYGIAVGGDDGDGGVFYADEPSGEQLRPFIQISMEADTPVLMDDVMAEVILDEGIAYFKGEKTLDEAVSGITKRTKTYLAQ